MIDEEEPGILQNDCLRAENGHIILAATGDLGGSATCKYLKIYRSLAHRVCRCSKQIKTAADMEWVGCDQHTSWRNATRPRSQRLLPSDDVFRIAMTSQLIRMSCKDCRMSVKVYTVHKFMKLYEVPCCSRRVGSPPIIKMWLPNVHSSSTTF